MSYTGRVDPYSHPYQFKVPDATTSQDGVMTKEQVALLEQLVAGKPIRLICTVVGLPPGNGVVLAPAGVYPDDAIVACYLVEQAVTISGYRITLCSGVVDDSLQLYSLNYSADQGNNFTVVPIAQLAVGQAAKAGTFAPLSLSPGMVLFGAMQRSAGSGNFSSGVLLNLF